MFKRLCKIPTVAIQQVFFVSIGILFEFAMLLDAEILISSQEEEMYSCSWETDVYIRQGIHRTLCLLLCYYDWV